MIPSVPPDPPSRTLLLLGAGELGQEMAKIAGELGVRVVAVGRYHEAPAMQVAHAAEVLPALGGDELEAVVRAHEPDFVVPESEAVDTALLERLEEEGYAVIPTAEAFRITARREEIRRVVAEELGIRTPGYALARSPEELRAACQELGFPCVVKPLRSWSGEGQSVVHGLARVDQAWAFAREGTADSAEAVLVEEYIDFHTEITLLTVRERGGGIHFFDPIGHRQERGAYQESWVPVELSGEQLREAREIATRVTDRLGGVGVFGVEFFVTDEELVFSEVSSRPHDTGFVTLVSHDVSQFELHVRALLGEALAQPSATGPAASAVILARDEGKVTGYRGVERAEGIESVRIRLFGKPTAYPFRRMGVALATGTSVEDARARALEAAARIDVQVT